MPDGGRGLEERDEPNDPRLRPALEGRDATHGLSRWQPYATASCLLSAAKLERSANTVVHQMRVDIEREAGGVVPEPPRYLDDVAPVGDQHARAGVPERVERRPP